MYLLPAAMRSIQSPHRTPGNAISSSRAPILNAIQAIGAHFAIGTNNNSNNKTTTTTTLAKNVLGNSVATRRQSWNINRNDSRPLHTKHSIGGAPSFIGGAVGTESATTMDTSVVVTVCRRSGFDSQSWHYMRVWLSFRPTRTYCQVCYTTVPYNDKLSIPEHS